ncbi:membrane-associated protein, putative [Bodo saltans]|uniref:Membrane-associated protein, putative n=1 Tax=Bodo saltans TaxID=75058 RepID=A0A0S4JVB1_BODSA|nr:membrane-associated protein, putative [Bodo saltans]|eukprot:CUG93983.1 membrane-associated protein, putative [Bodo saltans]
MPGGGGPRRSFLRATAIFVLPSSLLPVWIAILPSTSAAATLLISRLNSNSSCVATDAALAALGVVVSLSPSAALVLLWSASTDPSAPWTCVQSSYQQKGSGMPQSRWRRLTGRLLKRRWKWAEAQRNDRSNRNGASSTSAVALAQAWVVLLEYRVLWYAALDATLLVMVSSVAVIGGLDTTNTMLCQGATSAVVALLVGQLVLLLGLRPHTTLFSFVQSSTTLLLTSTGVVTQLLFVVISSTSTSGVWLAQVSAGCNLAVVGVSAVQMLIDMMSLLVAAKRRILTLSYRRSAEGQHRIESSSAEMMLSVHTSSDFHQHPLQELYDETSSRSASSNGHRSQVGRISPTDLAVFREASPHHGGGGRAVSLEGSFRGGGDSMRLKNMSMDSSSFLNHTEKKFWDRKGAAVSNGSFLFDAAVLGGRAVFVQQSSSPSPPGGASTTTLSARQHVGEDASRPSSSSSSLQPIALSSSPTTQIRTGGAPPTSSNQQQHPQGTPSASVVITSSSLQRGTAVPTQQTKEAAAAAALRSKATAATFTSSSSSDDDEDL